MRFPLPVDVSEARGELTEIRTGLSRLLSRFEPDRFRAVNRLVSTFGHRETLARLRFREPTYRYPRVSRVAEPATVH